MLSLPEENTVINLFDEFKRVEFCSYEKLRNNKYKIICSDINRRIEYKDKFIKLLEEKA